ncbi:hypothetical protein ACCD06_02305 [Azospirillum sp. CT11-132]|uniref:hypothetical protein n=1 Tax=Azospirillum sp. CT11-132 TaxID=3396317 RepID=UPI0039A6E251
MVELLVADAQNTLSEGGGLDKASALPITAAMMSPIFNFRKTSGTAARAAEWCARSHPPPKNATVYVDTVTVALDPGLYCYVCGRIAVEWRQNFEQKYCLRARAYIWLFVLKRSIDAGSIVLIDTRRRRRRGRQFQE